MENAAAGLGAMAFWLFLAAVVVAGIWYSVRERESRQETLRRVVESGQHLDQELIDKILAASGDTKYLHRDLKVAGLIVISAAPGLAVLGWFLARLSDKVLPALLGVSFLVGFVGIGLLVAAKVAERWRHGDQG